jgi:hypothetical protein
MVAVTLNILYHPRTLRAMVLSNPENTSTSRKNPNSDVPSSGVNTIDEKFCSPFYAKGVTTHNWDATCHPDLITLQQEPSLSQAHLTVRGPIGKQWCVILYPIKTQMASIAATGSQM